MYVCDFMYICVHVHMYIISIYTNVNACIHLINILMYVMTRAKYVHAQFTLHPLHIRKCIFVPIYY